MVRLNAPCSSACWKCSGSLSLTVSLSDILVDGGGGIGWKHNYNTHSTLARCSLARSSLASATAAPPFPALPSFGAYECVMCLHRPLSAISERTNVNRALACMHPTSIEHHSAGILQRTLRVGTWQINEDRERHDDLLQMYNHCKQS